MFTSLKNLFQFGCGEGVIFVISEVVQVFHKPGRNISHRMNPLEDTWEPLLRLWALVYEAV